MNEMRLKFETQIMIASMTFFITSAKPTIVIIQGDDGDATGEVCSRTSLASVSREDISVTWVSITDCVPLLLRGCPDLELMVVIDSTCDMAASGLASGLEIPYISTGICSDLLQVAMKSDRHDMYIAGINIGETQRLFSSLFGEIGEGNHNPAALMCDKLCQDLMPLVSIGSEIVVQLKTSTQNSTTVIEEDLKQLRQVWEIKNYIFMGTLESAITLLEQAYRHNLLSDTVRWLIFLLEPCVPICDICADKNVLFITEHSLQNSEPNYTSALVKDIYTEKSVSAVIMTIDEVYSTQVSFGRGPNLKHQNTFSDALRKHMTEFGRDLTEPNLEVLRFISTGVHTKVASWNTSDGLNADKPLFPFYKPENCLRIVTVVEPPFVFRNITPSGTVYYGYAIDVLNEITKHLGLYYTIKEPKTGTYGNLLADGEWDGCVKEVVSGSADMIVAALTVTAERESVVDFTTPYYDFAGIQIIVKRSEETAELFTFLTVFHSEVWYCILAVMFTTAILMVLYEAISRLNDGSKSRWDMIEGFKESMWFVSGAVTLSGEGQQPRRFPARLLVAGFWFFCLIIMSTFTANLAAFMTVSRMKATVESLDQLASQSAIKYSVLSGGSVMSYFKRMAEIEQNFYDVWKDMSFGSEQSLAVWDYPLGEKYAHIWSDIQRDGPINSTQEAVSRVLEGNFAFIHESPMIKYETSRNCELVSVGDQFSSRPYAFALRDNSPSTKKISNIILALQQELVLEELKTKWWSNNVVQCPNRDENSGLDLYTVRGIFAMAAMGLGCGFVSLVAELFCCMYYNKRTKKIHKGSSSTPEKKATLCKTGVSKKCNSIKTIQAKDAWEPVVKCP